MAELLSEPGMKLLLTVLVTAQSLSLLYAAALFAEFRHIHRKRVVILRTLGSARADVEALQAKILGSTYLVLTFLAAIMTSILFLWQPHLL